MSTAMALEETSGLLLHEAHCLDSRKWDEWLELYTEDAVFWVPAWKDEEHQTDNPDREVSMMYYGQRARLAERVWRARSGQSIASAPLPRTMHSVTNIVLGHSDRNMASLCANWSVQIFDVRRKCQHVFFGFYEYDLIKDARSWKIARKKVSVLNDHLPIPMDFYCI